MRPRREPLLLGLGGPEAAFQELLEHLHAKRAHRRQLVYIFLQLIEAADALHCLCHGIDIDFIGLRHIGQAEETPCFFRCAIDFDIHFHAVLPRQGGFTKLTHTLGNVHQPRIV